MTTAETLLSCALVSGLPVAMYLGHLLSERRWCMAARHPMRVESVSTLYHVVRDGDIIKARDVLASCVAAAPAP